MELSGYYALIICCERGDYSSDDNDDDDDAREVNINLLLLSCLCVA